MKFSPKVGVVEFLLNNGADVHAKDKVRFCFHCKDKMDEQGGQGRLRILVA